MKLLVSWKLLFKFQRHNFLITSEDYSSLYKSALLNICVNIVQFELIATTSVGSSLKSEFEPVPRWKFLWDLQVDLFLWNSHPQSSGTYFTVKIVKAIKLLFLSGMWKFIFKTLLFLTWVRNWVWAGQV